MRKTEGRGCVSLLLRDGTRRAAHGVAFEENGFGVLLDGELIAGFAVRSWIVAWEDAEHPVGEPEGCRQCEAAKQVLETPRYCCDGQCREEGKDCVHA